MTALWPVWVGILAAMFLLAAALTASGSARRLRETAHRDGEDQG